MDVSGGWEEVGEEGGGRGRGRGVRAGAGRGEKGLYHLEVCELELAEDDGGLEDARGRQGGAKGRAGDDVIHGRVFLLGVCVALGWKDQLKLCSAGMLSSKECSVV